MWLLSWLHKPDGMFRRPSEVEQTRVEVDDETIRYLFPDGRTETIAWADLCLVSVVTNSLGPFLEDVYYMLGAPGFEVLVPQSAQGADELARRLGDLPGFDDTAYIAAMASTSDARFDCWRKAAATPPP